MSEVWLEVREEHRSCLISDLVVSEIQLENQQRRELLERVSELLHTFHGKFVAGEE